MDTNVIPFNNKKLPALAAAFGEEINKGELSHGIQSSFPIISFRGSVWRIKHKGVETVIKNSEGDPVRSIKVIMLKASPQLSKLYYSKQYDEGDDSPPDCFSSDGIKPDPSATKPQCTTCAACPQNVWGSKITPSGNKTKACADNKRLAVVPAADLKNEMFGGPMLIRIPPASLSDLDSYSNKLYAAQVPFPLAETKLSFDTDASFPKLTFECTGIIEDEQKAQIILDLRNSVEVERILDAADVPAAPAPAASRPTANTTPVSVEMEQTEVNAESPAPKTATSEPPKAAKPTVAEEAPVASSNIDAIVGSLLATD